VKQYSYRVVENRTLWADAQLLVFDAPELAHALRPGQFALARDATTFDPYLRRVLWLYAIEGERVAFVLSARDPLAARVRVGDALDLLAPLGNAIEFDANARRVLLIGEGTRIVQLIALAHAAVAQAREVVLASPALVVNGGGQGVGVFPAHLLSPEIEYRTDDALNAELIAWADAIVASGSEEFYRALAEAIRAARYRLEPVFARVIVDAPMPCGAGACFACAVEATRGVQLACADGPAFDLVTFENRRM
jgi:dihydroorotate dehydrogenase electron transfer subunit